MSMSDADENDDADDDADDDHGVCTLWRVLIAHIHKIEIERT